MRNWVEPTRALALTWGRYTDRYLAGLLLIVGGAVQLQGANTWVLPLIVIGAAAHAIGWSIMPARGWRRIVAVVPSIASVFVLLTGPQGVTALTAVLACWLLVRHRPALSYVTLILPLASGVIIGTSMRDYSGMLLALPISAVVLVASAWLARLIASSALVRRP
jgi:hypothetical protein